MGEKRSQGRLAVGLRVLGLEHKIMEIHAGKKMYAKHLLVLAGVDQAQCQGGGEDWRSGEVQRSAQSGQARVQQGDLTRSVHPRGSGKELTLGSEKQEC